ncbi:MAG: hypothetical protein QOK08_1435, partial [Actinomycetota bacterium]|nr:hypothetical protein [Actinomycetota bacterium]
MNATQRERPGQSRPGQSRPGRAGPVRESQRQRQRQPNPLPADRRHLARSQILAQDLPGGVLRDDVNELDPAHPLVRR